MLASTSGQSEPVPSHPLDPLTADEISRVAATLRSESVLDERWRFASIELAEPAKDELAANRQGISRRAQVVCWNTADGRAYRALVSLADDTVAGWQHLPGQQPNMTVDEWHECDQM